MVENNLNLNKVLSEITNDLVGSVELSGLLNKIVEMVMRLLDAEVCSIFLDNKQDKPDTKTITMLAGSGFAKKLVGIAQYKTGEGLTGYIYETGKSFNIKSPQELKNLKKENSNDPIWEGKHDQEQWEGNDYKFRNLIVLPLKIKDEIFGVIKVENKKGANETYFNNDDVTIFEIIANVVSLAIENARLYKKFEKQTKSVAAKAAHRINNQATNYDGIEYELGIELSKNICNNDRIRSIKERISTTTVSLKTMVNEFKQFGKPLEIIQSYCNLNKIIGDEVWLAQQKLTTMSSGTIIHKKLDESIPELYIDESRFAEAIKELIWNSEKAIANSVRRNNGNITIITQYDEINGTIIFRIEDNGTGFPKDFPVFEAFSSTDTNSTGLGLCTVRELVERHDGEICNYNMEGGTGACIQFILKTYKK